MATVPLNPWRPSMATWHRALASGAFDDERVELLDGAVVGMNAPEPPHESVARFLTRVIVGATLHDPTLEVGVNSPLTLADGWEPLPDLYVHDPRAPRLHHPSRAHWVCEVANTSLRTDRLVKGPAYARADIAEFWIVDLAARAIEVHRDPTTMQGYATTTVITTGVHPITALPGVTIDVDALWQAAFPS